MIIEYPWNELPAGTTVCDVGGGIGALTMQLARKYPHLQLKLQDTPDRIVEAQTAVWPKECPDALKDGRIEFKAMDFLTESPIKGCDIYFVMSFSSVTVTSLINFDFSLGVVEDHYVGNDLLPV